MTEDVDDILRFIRELADHENLLQEVVTTRDTIRKSLFGPKPEAQVLLALWQDTPAGFALYHSMFSTFTGKPGIYLEDLYVEAAFRGNGIGKALLANLAKKAISEDQCRLDWSCLKWNVPSLDFYHAIGARELEDWTRLRLDGEALKRLAEEAE